jgi:hypothetical protein
MTSFYADMAKTNEWNNVAAQGEAKEKFPKGVFKVVISKTELKAGKSDPDSLVQHIELKVVEGRYKDMTIMDYPTLINKNEVAVRIGKSRLKAYIEATGKTPQTSLDELKGIPFKLRTDHKLDSFRANDGGLIATVATEIKGIYSLASTVSGEDLEPVSSNDTLSSPAGVAFKASLQGQGGSVSATAPNTPPSAPKAPTAPPVAPKAPPKPLAVDSGESPDWLTPDAE